MEENHKLTLSDYKKIWTPFCFMDESGTLGLKNHPYFTVGIIKCSQPYFLQQAMRSVREKNNFWWELKFNGLNIVKTKVALKVLEVFFETKSIRFSSYTIDKRSDYFKKEFNDDPFVAYEQITKHLIEGNLRKNEVLILLADDLVSPKKNKFEVNIKNQINKKFDRLAVAGVCRLNSQTNDLLQMTDLLVGAINYELLLKDGVLKKYSRNKKKFIKYLKQHLGVEDLTQNFRTNRFNIRFHHDSDINKKAIDQ